tara:strand:- start:1397 stop:2629 length:1233 start_codon:yes stop_codon:yes gene_type:complete
MKQVIIIIYYSIFLYAQTSSDSANPDIFTYTEKYHFDIVPDNGTYTIEIQNLNGNINIQGHFGSGMVVKAKHQLYWSALHKGITSKRENIIKVFHNEEDRRIHISDPNDNKIHRKESSFFLSVPINTNHKIEIEGGDIIAEELQGDIKFITNGGSIKIKSIIGETVLQNSGENIIIRNCEGHFRAHTSGGNIELYKNIGKYNVSSAGGDIKLNTLKGDVQLMTIGGSIFIHNLEGDKLHCRSSSGNIIAEEIQGNFVCQTKNGNIQVEFLEGLCNLTTNNGDISTDYLTGSIVLDAIRGNIFGENIFGSVQAYTSDGNIDFKISYDSGSTDFSISLETVYGNIDVSLPKNLPVTIEAEIQGGKMAGAISSDIPITIEDTESKIFARGLVNQGTIPMNLFTGKGYITIRED